LLFNRPMKNSKNLSLRCNYSYPGEAGLVILKDLRTTQAVI
jgi:hypothetical protein